MTAASYSAEQAVLGQVAVAVEVAYAEAIASWDVSVGSALSSASAPPAGSHYFSLAQVNGVRELRLRPSGGWASGTTVEVAYVVGEQADSERRAIFAQSSLVGQALVPLRNCTVQL